MSNYDKGDTMNDLTATIRNTTPKGSAYYTDPFRFTNAEWQLTVEALGVYGIALDEDGDLDTALRVRALRDALRELRAGA